MDVIMKCLLVLCDTVAVAAFPVKGVASPPESDAKLESGSEGGVGQHLHC